MGLFDSATKGGAGSGGPGALVVDYAALAATKSRTEFVLDCPAPLLIGSDVMVQSQPTPSAVRTVAQRTLSQIPAVPKFGRAPLVLPVHKVRNAFAHMITVGRTANNDIVLNDVCVSKFHAFFRPEGDHFELCDAGSENGTWVDENRLDAKGKGFAVAPGQMVRFASLSFRLFDPGAAWDRLRRMAARKPTAR